MRGRIIRIGNSRGIRIPKPLIREVGLDAEVEISVRNHALWVIPAHRPRAGWSEAFQVMAKHGDDGLLDGDVQGLTSWDTDEWEWP